MTPEWKAELLEVQDRTQQIIFVVQGENGTEFVDVHTGEIVTARLAAYFLELAAFLSTNYGLSLPCKQPVCVEALETLRKIRAKDVIRTRKKRAKKKLACHGNKEQDVG